MKPELFSGKYPLVAVDAIIKYYEKGVFQGIVLVERKNSPQGWALPGGLVEYGETLEQAVKRESKEETGLDVQVLQQLHTYSEPKRDPRHHVITTVFLCRADDQHLSAHTDAKKAKVVSLKSIPSLVFDHNEIIQQEKGRILQEN